MNCSQDNARNGSSRRERRHFTAEQKVAIVKRHLVDGVPVSDLCDQHDILPTQFYQWQKQLFEGGAAAFERKAKPASTIRSFSLAVHRRRLFFPLIAPPFLLDQPGF